MKKYIIGIDPDSDKSGVAVYDLENQTIELFNYSLPDLINNLIHFSKVENIAFLVRIEGSWLNSGNWHVSYKDSRSVAAKKGYNVGSNHQTGKHIVEFCEYLQIKYEIVKPLSLRSWGGAKISHDKISGIIKNFPKRSNQEQRDAALLAITGKF